MRRITLTLLLFGIFASGCGQTASTSPAVQNASASPAKPNRTNAVKTSDNLKSTVSKSKRRKRSKPSANALSTSRPRLAYKRYLGAAVSARFLDNYSPEYASTFITRYDSLTPENEMKMEFLQPIEGRFQFADADRLVRLALANGKRVRGHALIFGKQDPFYIKSIGQQCEILHKLLGRVANRKLTKLAEELTNIMRVHITTVMHHYGGSVTQWDVVNEAFEDDGSFHKNAWFLCIGPTYIEKAFKFARAANPQAKLFYNEYNAELPGARLESTQRLVTYFQQKQIPIDGVGLQVHTSSDFIIRIAEFGSTLDWFIGRGLTVELTEVDVGPGAAGHNESAQTQAYSAITQTCVIRPACTGLTVWGVSDSESWHKNGSPLPIGEGYRLKQSYLTMRKLVP